jgi:hypothetical protein
MYRRIRVLCLILFVAVAQSGCGLILTIPRECKNETPFTGIHDFFLKTPRPERRILNIVIPAIPHPGMSTKTDFLKDWGEPDEIISTSEDLQTWVYNKKLWCGVIPVLILPVPLILPVCDGFDRIDFKGSVATCLHTRSITYSGIIIFFSAGSGWAEPACRIPLPPNNDVVFDVANPASQVAP